MISVYIYSNSFLQFKDKLYDSYLVNSLVVIQNVFQSRYNFFVSLDLECNCLSFDRSSDISFESMWEKYIKSWLFNWVILFCCSYIEKSEQHKTLCEIFIRFSGMFYIIFKYLKALNVLKVFYKKWFMCFKTG